MSNVEQIQQATKDFGEAATASAHTFASSLQAVTNAHADFAKKLMQHGSEFISQLTSIKLLRWNQPGKAPISCSEFISITENRAHSANRRMGIAPGLRAGQMLARYRSSGDAGRIEPVGPAIIISPISPMSWPKCSTSAACPSTRSNSRLPRAC